MVKKIIYFDYSWVQKSKSGGAFSSVKNLHEIFKSSKFFRSFDCIFIINKSQKKNFNLHKAKTILFPKNFFLNCFYRFFFLLFVKQNKGDIYFVLNLYSPIFSKSITIINLIHDNQWMHFPENFSIMRKFWLYLNIFLIKIKKNRLIFTSNFLLNNFENKFYDNKKIVIPIAFKYRSGNGTVIKVLRKKKFNFILSSNLPHKNIKTIIKAHTLRSKKFENFYLVIAGIGQQKKFDYKNKILIFDELKELEKIWLYKNSFNFIIPSLYEGFGMVMSEALMYANSIISSNLKPLLEIGGNFPTYVERKKCPKTWKNLIFTKKNKKKLQINYNKERKVITTKYFNFFKD
jgi:hypothetical protein